jgi:hypothetical protein
MSRVVGVDHCVPGPGRGVEAPALPAAGFLADPEIDDQVQRTPWVSA